jgi:hypothetical protein
MAATARRDVASPDAGRADREALKKAASTRFECCGDRRAGSVPSEAATKWPGANLNLPLAARPCVGHIRPHGAVAEWLKAAVC